MKHFSLVVIGGGSGGLEAAYNAATLYKAKVAVVDVQMRHGPPYFSALGGTCVNVGCVPKKLFYTGALYRDHMRDAEGFGWGLHADEVPHNWEMMIAKKNTVVQGINDSYQGMFKDTDGLEFFVGKGTFVDTHTLSIQDPANAANELHRITFDYALIATGSWPKMPRVPGIEHCISSNEAFYLPKCPKSVLVVGGGYIAVEFTSIFRSYVPASGTVALCYRKELFLRGFDTCLREELRDQMLARKVTLMFNDNPSKVELLPSGMKMVTFESGKQLEFDVVMFATGRDAKTKGLNLDAIGVRLQEGSTAVAVDDYSKTSVDNIYAIGDVTDRIQLTPVAIHEGACFADTVFGKNPRKPDHTNVASAVFSNPPMGCCGMTEEEAVEAVPVVAVYRSKFLPLMHKITGAAHKNVFFKLVVDHTSGTVLGVHMLGLEAPELIQMVGIMMKMGVRIEHFYNTIGVHPTSAEELCSMRTPAYYWQMKEKRETLISSSL